MTDSYPNQDQERPDAGPRALVFGTLFSSIIWTIIITLTWWLT